MKFPDDTDLEGIINTENNWNIIKENLEDWIKLYKWGNNRKFKVD